MKISLYTLWNRFVASLSTQKKNPPHTPRLWLHQWLSEFQKCHKNYLVLLRGYQTYFFSSSIYREIQDIISLILPPLQKNCSLSLNIPSSQKNKFGCLTWKINKIKVIDLQLTQKGKKSICIMFFCVLS